MQNNSRISNDSTNFHYDDNQNNSDAQTQEIKLNSKSKIPKHNKFRLVYRYNSLGQPVSFIHINHRMALRIIAIIKYLKKQSDKVTVEKILKDLKPTMKFSQSTLYNTIHMLNGIECIDIKDENGYRTLMRSPIDVKQSIYHKKRNIPGFPQFMKPPLFISIARS